MKSKIKINRETLLSLLIFLPYIENRFTQNYVRIRIEHVGIIGLPIFLQLVAIFFMLFDIGKIFVYRERKFRYNNILWFFILYSFLASIIFARSYSKAAIVWLWLCIPILYSICVLYYCRWYRIDCYMLLVRMINLFSLYVAVTIIYYIPVHHLFLDDSVRLGPRGGGAVIFGYTIAVFFALCVALRDYFSKKNYYFILIILSIGSFGTASRASVWPVIFLWIINFLFSKLSTKKLVFGLLLVPVIIFLSSFDFSSLRSTSYIGHSRLFNIESYSRNTTFVALWSILSNTNSLSKIIFGTGSGNFFPYQEWLMYSQDIANNKFTYNGLSILVQPHNTFLYLLFENGVMGLILFSGVFIYAVIVLMRNREKRYIYQISFVGVMTLVNMTDAVFFVQPGVAGSFWILLLLVIEGHQNSLHNQTGPVYTKLD